MSTTRWTRQVSLTWTNWTFGIWSIQFPNRRRAVRLARGIDLGPLEIVWRKDVTRGR